MQFGALQVTPRACYTRPPTETANTDAFVEVDEVTLQGEVKRIFTGWMFASSPGLHGVEHAIYDVWLTNCKGAVQTVTAAPDPAPTPPPARTQPQPRAQQPVQPAQPPRAAAADAAALALRRLAPRSRVNCASACAPGTASLPSARKSLSPTRAASSSL